MTNVFISYYRDNFNGDREETCKIGFVATMLIGI